jgi:uncharacterized membrane protein
VWRKGPLTNRFQKSANEWGDSINLDTAFYNVFDHDLLEILEDTIIYERSKIFKKIKKELIKYLMKFLKNFVLISIGILAFNFCTKIKEFDDFYLGDIYAKKGVKVIYDSLNDYMVIEDISSNKKPRRFIEIYNVNTDNSDTTYGISVILGGIEKRESYFDNENGIIEIIDKSSPKGSMKELLQVLDSVPTSTSYFVTIIENQNHYILKPIYGSRLDSLVLRYEGDIITSGIETIELQKAFVKNTMVAPLLLEVITFNEKGDRTIGEYFVSSLSRDRIINYNELQDFSDSLRGYYFKNYLHPEIKKYADNRIN